MGRAAGSSATAGEEDEAVMSDNTVANYCKLALSATMLAAGSTISWKCRRKSTPMIWKETVASRKFQVNRQPCSNKIKIFSPQHGMS